MNLTELRIIGVTGAVLVILIGYAIWHHRIWEDGFKNCQAAQVKAVQEGNKQYDQAIIKAKHVPDDNLRREFCKRVRDADMPTCLKNLPAFRP